MASMPRHRVSITSSTKPSRVPEVGGGPSTSIFSLGSDGSIVRPVLVGIGDQLAVWIRDFLGQRQEDLLLASARSRARSWHVASMRPSKPILISTMSVTPCLAQSSNSRLLDAPRGVGDVGVVGADAGAEQLHAAAGAGRFDDRRLAAGVWPNCSATAVVNGIDRRRADDADLVAGECALAAECRRRRSDEEGERQFSHWKSPCLASWKSGVRLSDWPRQKNSCSMTGIRLCNRLKYRRYFMCDDLLTSC